MKRIVLGYTARPAVDAMAVTWILKICDGLEKETIDELEAQLRERVVYYVKNDDRRTWETAATVMKNGEDKTSLLLLSSDLDGSVPLV